MRKVVLVTGASRGIGAEIAKVFAENGYAVVINYNKSKLQAQKLAESLMAGGSEVLAVQADVSNAKEVWQMFNIIKDKFGRLDVLVNNAGVSLDRMLIDCTEDDFDKVFGVNVKGTFLCCREALDIMLKQKSGNIVNMSSIWGQSGASCESLYSATKGAIISLTQALADEYGSANIRVNSVAPGFVKTDMTKMYEAEYIEKACDTIPLGRLAKASEIAEVVYFVASSKNSYMTGATIPVNGGWY